MTSQRKRGRPKGSGKADLPILKRMAEFMVMEPGLKPTTAYRRLTKSRNPSDWRRIQMKWRVEGPKLLAEVQVRRAPVPKPSVATTELVLMRAAQQAARAEKDLRRAMGLDNTFRTVFDDWSKSSATVQAALESARIAREVFDSPAAKLAREFYDSPSARLAREMYNSPEMRLMREMRSASPFGWPKY